LETNPLDEEAVDHVSFVSAVLISPGSHLIHVQQNPLRSFFLKKKEFWKQQEEKGARAERLPGRNGRIKAVV
jgi:hypothetical protein